MDKYLLFIFIRHGIKIELGLHTLIQLELASWWMMLGRLGISHPGRQLLVIDVDELDLR